jgi:hypothetical protein
LLADLKQLAEDIVELEEQTNLLIDQWARVKIDLQDCKGSLLGRGY